MNTGTKYRFSIYGSISGISNIEGTLVGTALGQYIVAEANAQVNHANIYPALPEEIRRLYDDNHASYNYYHFVTDAGNHYYIGEPWINQNTLEELSQKIKVIEVIDPDDRDNSELTALLESRRYEVKSVTEKNVV